jgi:hypothetical protein
MADRGVTRRRRSAVGGRPLRRDFGDELRWTFRHRRGWLIGFVFNLIAAAAFVGYEHYDPHTGGLRLAGIAAEIAAWVIASTLATNQLGEDADHVVAHLRYRPGDVTRVLLLKNLVLACLLLPITIVVSIAVQADVTRLHELFSTVTEDLLDVFVVLLWLGIGSVSSVLLPYRVLPLRTRLRLRSTWPRWITCQVIPYLVFVAVIPPLVWPPYDVAQHLFGGRHKNLVEYASTFVLWGIVVWVAGLAVSTWFARRHSDRLIADLERQA